MQSVLLLWLALGVGIFAASAAANDTATVVVETNSPQSDPLPADFASFSVEVPCAKILLTYDGTGAPRTSYLNLVGYLRSASRSTRGPNLRIGGDSSDRSIYRFNCSTAMPLPSGISYCVSIWDLEAFKLMAAINGTITVGLNLGYGVVAEAVGYAAGVQYVNMPTGLIAAYEIGNEPDLYRDNGLRPPTYNYTGYSEDFKTWFDALRSGTTIPFPCIQGAVFCCDAFNSELEAYMSAYEGAGFFRSVSYHHYPLAACNGHVVTLAELLAPSAATSVRALGKYATFGKSFGKPFFVGEGNSVACGGTEGVSNTFGATLWSVDALFNAAVSNITRWNFHGCTSGAYTPVALSSSSGTSDTRIAEARPLFYGMWAFTDAIAAEAHVLSSSAQSLTSQIVVWSTRSDNWRGLPVPSGKQCSIRVCTVVIDKRTNATDGAEAVRLVYQGLSGHATTFAQVRGLAPLSGGATATSGIYFGGLTFDGSETGFPMGTANATLAPLAEGAVTVMSLPAAILFVEVWDDCE